MKLSRRIAAVVIPLGLVVGGVAYGVAHHGSPKNDSVGRCTTHVGDLRVILSATQARNATLISAIAIQRDMPAHAATIALAAALQESRLYNLHGGDRDSVGLFQQRPSQGWGTRQQILDPVHATNAFYDALAKVPGYDTMPVTDAAQHVQRSAYPTAYAVYERDARALASALTGYSPAAFHCDLPTPSSNQPPAVRRAAAVRRALRPAFGPMNVQVASGAHLAIPVGSGPKGWSVASYLVSRATELGLDRVEFDSRVWTSGNNDGWTRQPGGSSDAVIVG
jgi:hypothetical protein